MKIISTTISGPYVRLQLADADDPALAQEHIEIQMLAANLMLDNLNPLKNPQNRSLAATQRAALDRATDAINEQIEGLLSLLRPKA